MPMSDESELLRKTGSHSDENSDEATELGRSCPGP